MICPGADGCVQAAGEEVCDGEHLGVGDHLGEDLSQAWAGGGEPAVPVVPAFGERGMPSGCEPLTGDVPGLLVGACDVRVWEVPGAPVVAALAAGDLGQGRQAGTVDAAQPLPVPQAQVVAGAGPGDHGREPAWRGLRVMA